MQETLYQLLSSHLIQIWKSAKLKYPYFMLLIRLYQYSWEEKHLTQLLLNFKEEKSPCLPFLTRTLIRFIKKTHTHIHTLIFFKVQFLGDTWIITHVCLHLQATNINMTFSCLRLRSFFLYINWPRRCPNNP